jgi:hypothetical protein
LGYDERMTHLNYRIIILSHGVAAVYTETIREYIEKGYLRKVANDTTTRKWYLPHFVRSEKEALDDGISALRIHASAHLTI